MSELQIRPGVKLTTKSGKEVVIVGVRIWVNKNRLTDCLIDMTVDGKPKFGSQKELHFIMENY